MFKERKYENNLKELMSKHNIDTKQFAQIINRSQCAVVGMRNGKISIHLWIPTFEQIFKEKVWEKELASLGGKNE